MANMKTPLTEELQKTFIVNAKKENENAEENENTKDNPEIRIEGGELSFKENENRREETGNESDSDDYDDIEDNKFYQGQNGSESDSSHIYDSVDHITSRGSVDNDSETDSRHVYDNCDEARNNGDTDSDTDHIYRNCDEARNNGDTDSDTDHIYRNCDEARNNGDTDSDTDHIYRNCDEARNNGDTDSDTDHIYRNCDEARNNGDTDSNTDHIYRNCDDDSDSDSSHIYTNIEDEGIIEGSNSQEYFHEEDDDVYENVFYQVEKSRSANESDASSISYENIDILQERLFESEDSANGSYIDKESYIESEANRTERRIGSPQAPPIPEKRGMKDLNQSNVGQKNKRNKTEEFV